MRMITFAVLFTAAFASAAQAQKLNNNPLGDKQYTCNFTPTDAVRPGRIYASNKAFVFPGGFREKTDDITSQFDQPFNTEKAANYAGSRWTEKITVKAAADLVGGDDRKLTASGKKTIDIIRGVPNHKGLALTRDDLKPAYQWFEALKKTPDYNKNTAYFVVREVRFSDALIVSIDKTSLVELKGNAKIEKVADATVTAQRDAGSRFELEGKYPVPLVFCTKVERLK